MSDSPGGSAVVSALRRASRTSRLLGAARDAQTRLAAGVARSRVLGTVDRAGTTADRWVRGSWLYDWLTADPEPEVVVVDLRETYTVGPLVAALDRLAGWLGPRWQGSAIERRLARTADWCSRVGGDSRTARVLAVLLVPPELDERSADEIDDER